MCRSRVVKLDYFQKTLRLIHFIMIGGILFFSSSSALAQRIVSDLEEQIAKDGERLRVQKERSELPELLRNSVSKDELKKAKPTRKSRKIFRPGQSVEGALASTIDESIAQLYTLIAKFRNSPRRGVLWAQLGDNYLEKARFIQYRIEKQFEKKLILYEKGKIKKPPRLNLAPAHKFTRKANELYRWFVRDFSHDKVRMPRVLSHLGASYFDLGQYSKGAQVYRLLEKKYPKSPYILETYIRLAEFYFETEKWSNALKYFNMSLKRVRSTDKLQFLYLRRAWCYYRLRQTEKGLKDLEKVISIGSGKKNRKDTIHLTEEASRDLVWFFVELDGTVYKEARDYFTRILGSTQARKLLPQVAYQMADMGKSKESRYIFRDIISDDPTSEKAFEYAHQIVKSYRRSEALDAQFRRELNSLIGNYGPSGEWQKINARKPELIKKTNQSIEERMRVYVLQQHKKIQITKQTKKHTYCIKVV